MKAGEATLTPVGVVEGLRELGYELYPVLERELHHHKLAPYPMTRVIGTRFKGKGKPPAALLEAAAERRPYVAALVCATDPASTGIPWVALVVESYLSGRVFMIKRRRCRFTARTAAANLGALCGLETLEEWERLEPMIKEVLPR